MSECELTQMLTGYSKMVSVLAQHLVSSASVFDSHYGASLNANQG